MYVVGDNVDHDPNVSLVAGLDQSFQIVRRSEIEVHVVDVSWVVAVVSIRIVFNDRGNPNGIKSQI